MPASTRFLSLAAPLVFLAVAVVACSDGPTFVVGPAATDAGTTVDAGGLDAGRLDAGTTADTGAPDDAGARDAAGEDPNDPSVVCAKVAATIPAGAIAAPEVFGPNMIGCPGRLRYETRVVPSACGAGWVVCNASQVQGRPVNPIINPKYHYWLDPRLWASPGGDTGRCYAAPVAGSPAPSNCGNNTSGSMHFCSKIQLTASTLYNVPDDLGNTCAQVNCDYDPARYTSSTPIAGDTRPTKGDFGGCGNNETAGVLCCKN